MASERMLRHVEAALRELAIVQRFPVRDRLILEPLWWMAEVEGGAARVGFVHALLLAAGERRN